MTSPTTSCIDALSLHRMRVGKLMANGFAWSVKSRRKRAHDSPEGDAAYLITEVRKILEMTAGQADFPYLNFFCNWALHTSIDRSDIPVEILRRLSNLIIYGRQNVQEWIRPLERATFGEFRKELTSFLRKHALPHGLVRGNREWKQFLEAFIPLIVDSPIELNQRKLQDQRKEMRYRRKWGINAKLSMLTLRIIPPHGTVPRAKSRAGEYSSAPLLEWDVRYDNGDGFNIPCVFYGLKSAGAELALWHGLVYVGWDGRLS